MKTRLLRRIPRTFVVAAIALATTLLAGLQGASAAYPGANGKIAFQSSSATNLDIWSMNPDGSGQTNLTNDSAADSEPIWSPDGATIAFVKASEGHTNIWGMNADGSGQTNLTPGPAGSGQVPCQGPNGQYGITPSWSPNGNQIAYSVSGDIFVMNAADGTGKTNLTCTYNGRFSEAEPAWSPDGSTIAYRYHSDDAGVYNDIWVMNSDGTNRRPLTSTPAIVRESFPDWSPDGTQIVYQRSRPAGSIWKMNADGSGQTLLVGGEAGGCGRDPAWSPDGTKIVFSSNCFDAPNGYDIFVMNPDGTGVIRLPTPVPAGDFYPSWQPAATPLPTVKIGNATVVEGDAGTVAARFVLRLSVPSAQTVTVAFETSNGTAKTPADYQAASGTVSFAPGQTSRTVTVDVVGETLYEQTEKFSVLLNGSTNATIADKTGIGTIRDNDPQPSLAIGDASTYERNAGTTSWVFVVTLSTVSGTTTKVDYATGDGTAIAGSDYVAKNGTLSIPAGQKTKAISISVIGDTVVEPDETFVVTLSNPVGATLADDRGVGTIVNDD